MKLGFTTIHQKLKESQQWLDASAPRPQKAISKLSNKKVLALIFWDNVVPLLVEFFRKGTTITGEVYARILEKLKRKIIQKRGEEFFYNGVFLLHDNAPPHTLTVAKSKIQEVGFIELDHPPYSPALAPSDYYLFAKLKTFLRKKTCKSDDEVEKYRKNFLARKRPEFYNKGISDLKKRWEKFIRVKGEYVES